MSLEAPVARSEPKTTELLFDSFEAPIFGEQFILSPLEIPDSVLFNATRTQLRQQGVPGLLSFVLVCASVAPIFV